MAIPQQTATMLQRVALFDLVAGVGLVVYGATGGTSVITLLGTLLAVAGLGTFFFARSQRSGPDGPISDA
ncbi:hypothetical protein BH10ACT1_BH10ACT1_26610 [soil metagenome]